MFKNIFVFGLILGLVAFVANAGPYKPKLKGTTILYPPYNNVNENGSFIGFSVDLMDKIAAKAGFDYELSLIADGAYGTIGANGKPNGMIGELVDKKVDFAIADFTITETRKEFVDFTEPIFTGHFAIVIGSKYAENGMTTLDDLLKYNKRVLENDTPDLAFNFTAIKSGSTNAWLSNSTNTVAQEINASFKENPNQLVRSNLDGVHKVQNQRLAFIMESLSAEYAANHNCNITLLEDNRLLYQWGYGIALQKGSSWLAPFNQAIQELKTDGTIDQLKVKNWGTRNC